MKYKGKWGWIGSKMWIESFNFRIGTLGVLSALTIMLLLGVWNNVKPYILREVLDTKQEIEMLSGRSGDDVELKFDSAKLVGKCDIVKESVDSLMFSMNGIYAEVPAGTSEFLEVYDVWQITGNDFDVLFCMPEGHSLNKSSVIATYNAYMPNEDISEAFMPGAMVLFESSIEYNLKMIVVWGLSLLAVFVAYLMIVKSSILHKRSRLAKQISQYGNITEMVNLINEQAKSVRFECSKLAFLQDWFLFMETDGMMVGTEKWYIQPIDALRGIEVKQDEDDPEDFMVLLHYRDGRMSGKFYMKADEVAQLRKGVACLIE